MALKPLSFNSTDGTAVTTANSGLAAVSVGAGGSAVYKTAAAHQGTTGIRLTAAGAAVSVRGGFVNANPSQAAANTVIRIPSAAPTSDVAFLTFTDTAFVRQSSVIYASGANAGRFYTNDKNNTYTPLTTATQSNSTNLPPGTPVRVEMVVTNTSATVGAFTCRLYNADTGIQIGSTVSVSNANLGGNNIMGVTLGLGAISYSMDFDSLQTNDNSTTEIGAYVSSINPPTATASADIDTTVVGSPVAFGATASTDTPNGMTLDHYNWTVLSYPPELGAAPAISNPTSGSPQITPSVTGRYQLQVTATDSGGNTSAPDVQTLYVRGSIVEIIDTVSSVGGFTISSLANLTDNNDATDLTAPSSAVSEATFTGQLAPIINAPVSFIYTVRYKLDAAASGVTFKVRLIEGSTVRKEWTPTAPTTTAQNYDCTLSSGEIATISDWKALKMQFAWQT